MISVGGEFEHELVIGEAASLWQAVHATANLNIDETIVEERLQFALVDYVVGQHPGGNAHVFVAIHGRPEIKIFEIDGHELRVGSGEDTIEEQLGSG